MDWTVGRIWKITKFERGWSLNRERTWSHFSIRAKEVKKWKDFFKEEAELLEIPKLDKMGIDVYSTFATRSLQDPGNNMPAVKAAVDGLVAAGIVEDDIPEHVGYITFHSPIYEKGVDSVCLLISELLSGVPSVTEVGYLTSGSKLF